MQLALFEDLGAGDLTTKLTIDSKQKAQAQIAAREDLTLSGLAVACEVFRQLDETIEFTAQTKDGDFVSAGQPLCLLKGSAASILSGERCALNFLMRLSGVATTTKRFVEEADNPKVRLVDTRKTTPGLRILEKQAVLHGGGHNHRFNLADGVLIKDNHIAACGSITQAVQKARQGAPHTLKIEVEVDTLEQLSEALAASADIVLLDNMGPDQLKKAVEISDQFYAPAPRRTLLEASGGVNLKTIKALAQTGVDIISVGALTHSAKSCDLGLDWL